MVNKYFNGKITGYNGKPNLVDEELEQYAMEQIEAFEKKWQNYEIANAIQEIWNLIARTNKYIDETMPWTLAKEEKTEELNSVMYHLIENLRKIAIMIKPFMNETADNILHQIGIENNDQKVWNSLQEYDKIQNIKVIEKGQPIFMRLNVAEEVEYIKGLMKK